MICIWCRKGASSIDSGMRSQVYITSNGRMILPVDVRKRLGLEETDGEVVLRTVSQAVVRAQAMSRAMLEAKPDLSVDSFISDRRKWQE